MVEGWKNYKLGELGKTYTGLSGKTKDDFGEGSPFVTYLNIFNNFKIKKEFGFVRVKKTERQNKIQYGDIFFTTSSETPEEVGMSSVVIFEPEQNIYLNSFCFGFRLDNFDKLNPNFASYYLRGHKVRGEIFLLSQGSTRFNLSKTKLLRIELEIPESLPEQQKIADILTKVDETIEATEKIIAKDERIKKGLMQDLFSKGIDENGNLRSEETHEFKDSELGRIPKEWDELKIYTISDIHGRVGWKGYAVKDLRKHGPLTLGAGNIDNKNKLDLTEKVHLSMEKYLESPEIMVKKGDILIVQRGSIGKLTIVDKDIEKATINPSVVLLNNFKINNFYFYYFLCTDFIEKQINDSKSQTGVPMISQKQIENFLIKLPKKPEEQQKIASILSSIDSKIQKEKQELNKLKRIKEGLMQDLLTGKVRVNHLIQEVAA